jgi:hypothetical protein
MKKIIYLSVLFCSISLSAQKSYEQYKQERQYAQRYANEQKQQFFKNVEKALNRYNIVVTKYIEIARKNKSEIFVTNNYPQLSNERMNLFIWVNSNSKYMTYSQLDRFENIHHKYLVMLDTFGGK